MTGNTIEMKQQYVKLLISITFKVILNLLFLKFYFLQTACFILLLSNFYCFISKNRAFRQIIYWLQLYVIFTKLQLKIQKKLTQLNCQKKTFNDNSNILTQIYFFASAMNKCSEILHFCLSFLKLKFFNYYPTHLKNPWNYLRVKI